MCVRGGGRGASGCGIPERAPPAFHLPVPLPRPAAPSSRCPQAQDDWVPLDVVRDLAHSLFRSSHKLLTDICPADELRWDDL